MERRLEKIELKINELYGKKLKNVEEKRAAPGRTGSGVFRCSMGRALLMLSIFGAQLGQGGMAVDEKQGGKVREIEASSMSWIQCMEEFRFLKLWTELRLREL
jgi:hypothetical protein